MSLGPVVRNVLDTKAEAPKPHLRDRLRTSRIHADGVLTDNGGKLQFTPCYAGERPPMLAARRKEPAYVPFQGEHAVLDPNPGERVKITNIPTLSGSISAESRHGFTIGERVLKADGMHRGETVEIVGFLVHSPEVIRVRRDDGEVFPTHYTKLQHLKAEAPAPAKPKPKLPEHGLTIGQRVQKFLGHNAGQVGTVTKLHSDPDDGGDERQCVYVKFDNEAIGSYWTYPNYLEALDTKPAFDPMTEPLRVGDRVKCIYSCSYKGKEGVITKLDEGSRERKFRVKFDGAKEDTGNFWSADPIYRTRWQLIERPNT